MTRQQQWSLGAHRKVLAFKEAKPDQRKKLNTFCHKMPSLIQQAGLMQALVFIEARGDAPGQTFLDALAAVHGADSRARLRGAAQAAELADYLALTRDLTDVATWFRRFAQIELGQDTED